MYSQYICMSVYYVSFVSNRGTRWRSRGFDSWWCHWNFSLRIFHWQMLRQPSVRTNTNRSVAEYYRFQHVCLTSVSSIQERTANFCALWGPPPSYSLRKLGFYSRPWSWPLNAWSKTAILSYAFVTRCLITRSCHFYISVLTSICMSHPSRLWFYHLNCSGWKMPVTKPLVV